VLPKSCVLDAKDERQKLILNLVQKVLNNKDKGALNVLKGLHEEPF
jgi:hypothetical protein